MPQTENIKIDIWGVEEIHIAPQPFNLMIVIAACEIVGAYLACFCSGFLQEVTISFSLLCHVTLLFFFRGYLRNFKSRPVILWMNCNIVVNCLLFLITGIAGFNLDSLFQKGDITARIIYLCLYLLSIVIAVIYGLKLRRIKNDPVGLLKELGASLAFGILVCELLIGALSFTGYATSLSRMKYYNETIQIMERTVYNIPPFIMILIFVRAANYLKKEASGKLS